MEDEPDLPGSVSNQNQEEAEPGHGDGGDEKRREGSEEKRERPSGGEAGEGSQSTGHPDSAG